MSLHLPEQAAAHGSRKWRAAFTVPQLMVVLAIFMLVVIGILSSHVFGLRMMHVTQTKLGASETARRAINQLANEIRSAKSFRVGEGSQAAFQEVSFGNAQSGNALQIYPGTDTNVYVRFFVDDAGKRLMRLASGGLAPPQVVVEGVSNHLVFACEDLAGNVITNRQANCVLLMALAFDRLQYPDVAIGPGQYYTSYTFRTRINVRAAE